MYIHKPRAKPQSSTSNTLTRHQILYSKGQGKCESPSNAITFWADQTFKKYAYAMRMSICTLNNSLLFPVSMNVCSFGQVTYVDCSMSCQQQLIYRYNFCITINAYALPWHLHIGRESMPIPLANVITIHICTIADNKPCKNIRFHLLSSRQH